MRTLLGTLVIAAVVALAPSSAPAGFFELAADDISRDRHCDHNPCRRNGLAYKHRYVKGRYLRYEIESARAEYRYHTREIMVTPP